MTLVDGRKIAEVEKMAIQARIKALGFLPKLAIITCNPNFATVSYLDLKKKTASSLGVVVEVVTLPKEATTEMLITAVLAAVKGAHGVVVQLPLPSHIDTKLVLEAIPKTHDIDNFRYQGEETTILPPVVGAIDLISREDEIDWSEAKVVVFGEGRLVGAPMLAYAKAKGASVLVVDKSTNQEVMAKEIKNADIVVLGVGKPKLLTMTMVKPGVVIFDAGASEDGGVLVGDADPTIASIASLFTPVPGGIGPITIAVLFRNLLDLATRQ